MGDTAQRAYDVDGGRMDYELEELEEIEATLKMKTIEERSHDSVDELLSNIVCFSPDSHHGHSYMEEDSNGDWVRYQDVKSTLITALEADQKGKEITND